ncbi:hypothetical protein [Leucobacter sp. cx-169]|uniref:hypothetical protein n=1 Tax=Leucobacter sp. cx-169 TaxID=2770549 RepID=UPI00165EAC92|nr:hypothetical protein [Leucobacter sp. cx-169]MBC9927278.1 hypothetical protein [Leucobacter sp. cx-169]
MAWKDTIDEEATDFSAPEVPLPDVELDGETGSADATEDTYEDLGDSTTLASAGKPRAKKRAGGAAATGLTRSQVLGVIATQDAVAEATQGARDVLGSLYKSDTDVDELTVMIVSQRKLSSDPLSDLLSLLEAMKQNPFLAIAQLTGMDKATRSRVHAILAAAGAQLEAMPKGEAEAAAALGMALQGVTSAQEDTLAEAQLIREG